MSANPSNTVQAVPARQQTRLRVMLAILLLLSPFAVWNLWEFSKVMRARYAVGRIESLGGRVFLNVEAIDALMDPIGVNESVMLGWQRRLFGDTSAGSISLSGLPITDADLGCLNGFQKIYGICLDDTPITDAGLDFLAGRAELQYLSLRGTGVTDSGLKKLTALIYLSSLQLSGTKITDDGLKYLERFNMLTDLKLSRTQVTDVGLPHIEKVPHLLTIELDKTAVSEAGRDRLKKLCSSRIPHVDD